MTFIPEHLVLEILSCTPVKTLTRFRAVCKAWSSMISDPDFVKMHLHKTAKTEDLSRVRIIPKREFNHLDRLYGFSRSLHSFLYFSSVVRHFNSDDMYYTVNSCNGLVCVASPVGSGNWRVGILNTTTRVTCQISPPISINEDFDTIKFGFGHNVSSNTYKVVAILEILDPEENVCRIVTKVYRLRDIHWSDIENSLSFNVSEDDPVYFDGKLNWIGVESDKYDEEVIISFDLETETWSTKLPLPEHNGSKSTLAVCRDSLYVSSYDVDISHIVIWQMEDNYMSWHQLLKVRYIHLGIREPYEVIPLWIFENRDVLMLASSYARGEGSVITILYKESGPMFEHFISHTNIFELDLRPKIFFESLLTP